MFVLVDWTAVVSALAAMIAALASVASVFLARQTVREAQNARREERRWVRPYLSIESPKAWSMTGGNLGLKAGLHNRGEHLACNVTGRIFLIECNLGHDPLFSWTVSIAQIIPNDPYPWQKLNLQIPSELLEHYFVFALHYDDGITGESFEKTLGWRWRGVSGGKPSEVFVRLNDDELRRIHLARKID